jgi:hypothetical protein
MTAELAKLLKNASPECLALRESNYPLYVEIFTRGANAVRRQMRERDRSSRDVARWRTN